MNTKLIQSRRLLSIGGVVLFALGALATEPVVRAQDTAPTRDRYEFQSVGFIAGQTIRVSVARLAPPPIGDVSPPQPDQPPPVSDRVRIFLLDASGERIADSGPMVWPPGPTRTFDVERARLDLAGEDGTGRLQVRVVVVVSNPSGFPPGPTRPGVEVIATRTGRTTLVLYPPGPTRF
jgi:hypothetical protein